jgi:signal transduction histidine kinase
MIDANFFSYVSQCRDFVSNIGPFLYYSHMVPIIASLGLSFYSYFKIKEHYFSRLLAGLALLLAVWSIADLVIWLNVDRGGLIMLAWSLVNIASVGFFVLGLFLVVSLVTKKPPTVFLKTCGGVVVAFITILSSLKGGGIESYDLVNCIATESELYSAILLIIQVILTLVILGYTGLKIPQIRQIKERRHLIGVVFSLCLFYITFFFTSYISTITDNFFYEQFGILMMAVMVGIVVFLMSEYQLFQVRLLTIHGITVALILVTASQFIYADTAIERTLITISTLFVILISVALTKSTSILIDVKQKLADSNENLEHANARLKELDALKSEFVSLASHQMRGPLGAIKGYVSLISEGELGQASEQVRDAADKVGQATNSLMIMVEDFLNVSRIEQGRMKYVFKKIDLVSFVEEAVLEMKPSIEAKNLSLNFQLGEPGVFVEADEAHLKQVVVNLIDNAVKYTKEGGITITITKHFAERKVHVRFADTGVGISPDMKERLFEKFSRAKDAAQVNAGGTGLGLYVAKEMMRAHRGNIWAESLGKEKGTTFVVELPLSEEK